MKKAVIAGGVLALGAAWTGAAWYSGKMAEAFLRESLEQDNAQAKALGESTGYSIVTELISFERGVFTSTARSRLTLSIPGAETREIDIVEHADHGPFPFRRLAAGDFRPAMLATRLELQATSHVNAWFAATQDVTPLTGTSRVSYGKQLEGTYELAPMAFVRDGAKLSFSGMNLLWRLDRVAGASEFSGRLDSLTLDHAPTTTGLTGMALQGGAFAFRGKPGKNDVPLFDRKLSFQTLTIRHASLPPIIVQSTSLALDLIEADSGLALKTALDVGMINGWEKDVATARLALDLKHLDSDALSALDFINFLVIIRTWQGVVQGNIPPFSSDDLEELITSIDQILMGSAQVSLAPLQLGAVAGALNVNLDMELRKQAAASRGSAGLARIRKLNTEIELSQAGTVDLLVFWARLMGVPAEQALARVRPVVAEAAGKWAAMGLLKIENDTVRSTLSITMDEVDVNGTRMPLDQFLRWFTAGNGAARD